MSVLEGRSVSGARVSHFFSVLLLLTNLMLTLCFGVAAWRVSDDGGAGKAVGMAYGWMQISAN
ncbi:hypothetical protein FXB41_38770 [Bradyrhizobium canariense]|nr:hypothetical protein [Bradyrhizobium canariense]